MKPYMKKYFPALIALATVLTLGSCQEEPVPEVPPTPSESGQESGFKLIASYGDPGSKAVFDDDGLGMMWTSGDALTMINTADASRIYILTTDITNPAKVAEFTTEEAVAPGSYIVINNQDRLGVEIDTEMTSDLSELAKRVRMYSTVNVNTGDTEATIVLQQLFTMLTFKFVNVPTGFADGLTVGMAVAKDGLPDLGSALVTSAGAKLDYSGTWKAELGKVAGAQAKTLIVPADLTGGRVHFYAKGQPDASTYVVYDFVKSGFKLLPGKNYSVTFDFSKPGAATTLTKVGTALPLLTPADFRAAAFLDADLLWRVESDVDFDGEDYFPIRGAILGEDHTLSKVQIPLAQCDYVGLASEGSVSHIKLSGAEIKGRDRVGSMVGDGNCYDCHADRAIVSGREKVGGIVGYANGPIRDCSFLGWGSVTGTGDEVGGIVGNAQGNCLELMANGSVQGGSLVGGIAGYCAEKCDLCGFEGGVKGSDTYVGGVVGQGQCTLSYCKGAVVGNDIVGGVIGMGTCTNCYHIGDVTGGIGKYNVGGVNGSYIAVAVKNCYSCGTVQPTGIGITPKKGGDGENLTSCSLLYDGVSSETNCNCGSDKTFVSLLTTINGDGVYSDICWPDNKAGCPMFKWQLGNLSAGIEIPGFEAEEW